MAKLVNEEIYYDLAQNGARRLLEQNNMVLLDGFKDETISHFLVVKETIFIQLTTLEAYEILALDACPQVEENLSLFEMTECVNEAFKTFLNKHFGKRSLENREELKSFAGGYIDTDTVSNE